MLRSAPWTGLLLLAGAVACAQEQGRQRIWTVGGLRREGLVFLPAAANKPAPVVFAFHGHGGNMRSAARGLGIHRQWPEAIVVYPSGLPTATPRDPQGKRPGWQTQAGQEADRDLRLVDVILKTLHENHKVDDRRIYATGFSNGGAFTYLLWSARPGVFAAYAPCGSILRRRDGLTPAPILHVAGEKDLVANFSRQLETMRAVREIDGCNEEPIDWAPGCKLYRSKDRPNSVFVSFIHPGGHVFPRDAASLIVQFFKEHPRDN